MSMDLCWSPEGDESLILKLPLLPKVVATHYIPLSAIYTISILKAVRLVTEVTFRDTGRWLVMVSCPPSGGRSFSPKAKREVHS